MTSKLAVIYLAIVINAFSQSQYDPYPRDLLFNVFSNYRTKIDSTKDINIITRPYAFKVYVSFGDSSRPVTAITKRIIKDWAIKVLRFSESEYEEDVFTKEYLFYENEKAYWLPVQKGLLTLFSNNVKKDLEIDLFITVVGSSKSQLVLTVNEVGLPFPVK